MLCAGNSELGEAFIERGIFQGDSLFPLAFVLASIPLTFILRKPEAAYEFQEAKRSLIIFYLRMT